MVLEILKRITSFAVVRQSRFLSSTFFCLSATAYFSHAYTNKLQSTLLPKLIARYSGISLMSNKMSPMKSEIDSPAKILLHEKDGSIFDRDPVGTKGPGSASSLKIICWNVAGLRGTLKKSPEVLNELVDKQQPDLLCLQETKLQNIGDFGSLLADRGYKGYWTFSEVKKGYAGTVIFVRELYNPDRPPEPAATAAVSAATVESGPEKKKTKRQAKLSTFFEANPAATASDSTIKAADETVKVPKNIPVGTVMLQDVLFLLPDSRFNGEGRWTQIETPDFFFINTYVPNSGQNLERLDYRCDEWEPYVREYLNKLREKKPVIYSGDLNVAHTDLDVYNFQAKHLLKQAGTTLREKEAFSQLLDSGFRDSLRLLYPGASGQFTYWSQRTRARPFNKGLRLDYFVCSKEMFDDADSDGEVEVIKEGTSSSSAAVQESEASEQVADGVKSKAKSSKKKAPAVSPMKDIKPALEESSKTPSKEYPNPRNAKVLDSYILPYENDCSDHCPICLIVERNI